MARLILLVTTDHEHVASFEDPEHLGRLVQPRSFPRVADTARAGMPWAADNDAFNGWGPEASDRWHAMLEALEGLPGCRFVTVPDVVGDAIATARMFEVHAPAVERRGLPVGLVLQDGIDEPAAWRWLERSWHRVDAVFVGGTNEFKLGPVAMAIVRMAKRDGKWAHMGRVNTLRRMRRAASIGCDSIDGTSYVRFRRKRLPEGLAWIRDVSATTQEVMT